MKNCCYGDSLGVKKPAQGRFRSGDIKVVGYGQTNFDSPFASLTRSHPTFADGVRGDDGARTWGKVLRATFCQPLPCMQPS